MKTSQPLRIETISAFHTLMGLPRPAHPLISLVNFADLCYQPEGAHRSRVHAFYSIALKRNFEGKLKYGQQQYDFDEGILLFIAPGQVLAIEADARLHHTGWLLLIHPDFFWNTSLAGKISRYEFFSYAVHEALHLSEREENTLVDLIGHIGREYHAPIDEFSQAVIIAQLELLLTYADRFYRRQFITRKQTSHQLLNRFEQRLDEALLPETLSETGLPTVQALADDLAVSPQYLSTSLKLLTGQTAQQHIHARLIDKAKEQLSTTDLTVSEIAFALGFEHAQSFSQLFRQKTRLSPLQFRHTFN
ncbi:AraC family transcriptional regulator [Spirosoma luteolum]